MAASLGSSLWQRQETWAGVAVGMSSKVESMAVSIIQAGGRPFETLSLESRAKRLGSSGVWDTDSVPTSLNLDPESLPLPGKSDP